MEHTSQPQKCTKPKNETPLPEQGVFALKYSSAHPWADIKIRTKDGDLMASSYILYLYSEYFRAALRHYKGHINMTKYSKAAVETLLVRAYEVHTDQKRYLDKFTRLTPEHGEEFGNLLKQTFDMTALSECMCVLIESYEGIESICAVAVIARDYMRHKNVQKAAAEWLQKQISNNTPKWSPAIIVNWAKAKLPELDEDNIRNLHHLFTFCAKPAAIERLIRFLSHQVWKYSNPICEEMIEAYGPEFAIESGSYVAYCLTRAATEKNDKCYSTIRISPFNRIVAAKVFEKPEVLKQYTQVEKCSIISGTLVMPVCVGIPVWVYVQENMQKTHIQSIAIIMSDDPIFYADFGQSVNIVVAVPKLPKDTQIFVEPSAYKPPKKGEKWSVRTQQV